MTDVPLNRNILERWDITVEELSAAVEENGSLRGMMLGYVAEIKLRELIAGIPQVSSSVKDDDHNRKRKGDRRIVYRGQEFLIESKSLQTNSVKRLGKGRYTAGAQCDGSDRRMVTFSDGSKLETTNLLKGQFDVLAVNLFALEEEWRWLFVLNRDLPTSSSRKYTAAQQRELLATMVKVTWPFEPPFTDDLCSLLDILVAERNG